MDQRRANEAEPNANQDVGHRDDERRPGVLRVHGVRLHGADLEQRIERLIAGKVVFQRPQGG
jgi:hypothetical protein